VKIEYYVMSVNILKVILVHQRFTGLIFF